MTVDFALVGAVVERFGLPLAFLFILVWSGWKKYWVFGWYTELLEKQNAYLLAENKQLHEATAANAALLAQIVPMAERNVGARGR